MDLLNYFDRVAVINLQRRPDRLAQFFEQEQMREWPFKVPEIIHAVDGWNCKPKDWGSGSGSYGCQQSHLRLFADSMEKGVQSLLVLEDDAYLAPKFLVGITDFLTRVPDDWEILMLGGQHRSGWPPETLPGIRKCTNCQRTHAYAIRGTAIKDLHDVWAKMTSGHIDHVMGPWAGQRVTYSPDPFLFGQSASRSDITCKDAPLRFWCKISGLPSTPPRRNQHPHVRLRDVKDYENAQT